MAIPRTPDEGRQQPLSISWSHAVATDADRTDKFWKCPAGKKFRVDLVQYVNVTGLAEHAANFAVLTVQKGTTAIASYSTDSAGAGDNGIPADTFIDFTLTATDANRVLAAGDVLSLKIDESGTTTVPAGTVIVHGRYV